MRVFRGMLFLCVALFAIVLSACVQGPPPTNGTGGNAPVAGMKIKIGFAMATVKEERWQRDRDAFKAHCEKMQVDCELTFADNKAEKQLSDVEQLLTKGIDVLIMLFLMVVAFTYFYTAITVNPNQLADDMKRNGGFIPGVKPGKHTAGHIDELLSRITLPGAVFLGLIAILPTFAEGMGIKQGFAQYFGGTSLLIMVDVLLDTLQQIERHLLMRHYDGLMKSGRIKGRASGAAYGMAG